jgi:hypothetical protein
MHIFPVDLSPKSNCTHNLNIENVNWIKILHQKSLKYFILVSISPPHLHKSDVIDVTHAQEVPIFVIFPPPFTSSYTATKFAAVPFLFMVGEMGSKTQPSIIEIKSIQISFTDLQEHDESKPPEIDVTIQKRL